MTKCHKEGANVTIKDVWNKNTPQKRFSENEGVIWKFLQNQIDRGTISESSDSVSKHRLPPELFDLKVVQNISGLKGLTGPSGSEMSCSVFAVWIAHET